MYQGPTPGTSDLEPNTQNPQPSIQDPGLET